MLKYWRGWLLAGAVVCLVGASPAPTPDVLRQANDAYEREDFARAVELYTVAEEAAPDPGVVAFNKATALYRLALTQEDSGLRAKGLREAADYFGRLQDDPQRRGRALYGRANCLLHGQSSEAGALREAIAAYRVCLNDPKATDVHANARHNLELAKLLWVKANQKSATDKPDKKTEDKGPKTPENKTDQRPKPMEVGGTQQGNKGKPNDKGQKTPVKPMPGGNDPVQVDDVPPPGTGNLPPVPDSDTVVPLSPDDAARHLDLAANKIQSERRIHRLRTAPKLPETVKDW